MVLHRHLLVGLSTEANNPAVHLQTEISSFWVWGCLCLFQDRDGGMQPDTKVTQEIYQAAENNVQFSSVSIHHSGLHATLSILPLACSFSSVFLSVSMLWKSRSFPQAETRPSSQPAPAPFPLGSVSGGALCRAGRGAERVPPFIPAAACFQRRFQQGQPRPGPAASPGQPPVPAPEPAFHPNPVIREVFWEVFLSSPQRGVRTRPPAPCSAAPRPRGGAADRGAARRGAQGPGGSAQGLRERAGPRKGRARSAQEPRKDRASPSGGGGCSAFISPQALPADLSASAARAVLPRGGGGSAGAPAPLKSFGGSSAGRRQRGFVLACAWSTVQSRKKK